jgi:hypothetical protein
MNVNIEPLITIKSSCDLEIFIFSRSDIETCLFLLMFGEPRNIQKGKRFSQIICSNLRKFEQVIVRNHS